MTATLLALLLISSVAAVCFARRRRWTSVSSCRLEPQAEESDPDEGEAPEAWSDPMPPVAVIVPARNEEAHLEETLASLAALDYPAYRVVVVDDGSADGTAGIAESFAERWASRFQCIAAGERPSGWGAKVWAMERGLRVTTEPWVLFTDADVTHHRLSLARAMERARESGAAIVSVIPRFRCEGFWEKLLLPSFLLVVANRFPPGLVRDPRSRVAAAAGGFLLVRREALERAGGLESVRGRVAEDVALAREMKPRGERIDLSYTRELLTTRMYSSFGEIAEGLGKHAHEGTGGSSAILGAAVLVAWIATVVPFAILLGLGVLAPLLGLPPIRGPIPQAQGVVCAIAAVNYVGMKKFYEEWVDFLEVPFGFAWLYPLASIVYGAIALRAALQRLFGTGPVWKGRRIVR